MILRVKPADSVREECDQGQEGTDSLVNQCYFQIILSIKTSLDCRYGYAHRRNWQPRRSQDHGISYSTVRTLVRGCERQQSIDTVAPVDVRGKGISALVLLSLCKEANEGR